MPSGTSFSPARGLAVEVELVLEVAVAAAAAHRADRSHAAVLLELRPWYRIISPGLSSVPANRLPIITALAPTASALVMSPE